jgi:hypothetical protein
LQGKEKSKVEGRRTTRTPLWCDGYSSNSVEFCWIRSEKEKGAQYRINLHNLR